jgi:signal transduction histidine kinase
LTSDQSTIPIAQEWLLNTIQEGCLELDAQGRVERANGAAADMLGRAREAMAGMTLAELFPWIDASELDDLVAGRVGHAPGGLTQVTPLGVMAPMRLCTSDVQGRRVVVVFDQTARLHLEAELTRLKATMAVSQELLRHKNEELDRSLDQMGHMNRKLENLDELKSQFLSNMSHELRTPLSAIIGSLQLMRDGLCSTPEETDEYAGSALDAAQLLLKVINELLDSAKLSAGKMQFLIGDHKIIDLFDEAYSQLNTPAKQKGLKLTFMPPPMEGLRVRADFEKVKQLFALLVGNAIKFTREGGVTVRVERSSEEPGHVAFSIRDTGIGIPIEHQQLLFKEFAQADAGSRRRYSGTGLGLALSRNLVEMMGGTIAIHSDGPNRGTEVTFTLPEGTDGGAHFAQHPRDSEIKMEGNLPMTF